MPFRNPKHAQLSRIQELFCKLWGYKSDDKTLTKFDDAKLLLANPRDPITVCGMPVASAHYAVLGIHAYLFVQFQNLLNLQEPPGLFDQYPEFGPDPSSAATSTSFVNDLARALASNKHYNIPFARAAATNFFFLRATLDTESARAMALLGPSANSAATLIPTNGSLETTEISQVSKLPRIHLGREAANLRLIELFSSNREILLSCSQREIARRIPCDYNTLMSCDFWKNCLGAKWEESEFRFLKGQKRVALTDNLQGAIADTVGPIAMPRKTHSRPNSKADFQR